MLHVCEWGSHDKKILADRCPELKDLGTYSREFYNKIMFHSPCIVIDSLVELQNFNVTFRFRP